MGVGNEGDVVGGLRTQGTPFSKVRMETSTDKGDPSLGFAVTPAPGAPCAQVRACLDWGRHLGVVILCVLTNCKLSKIKCTEFRST